VTAPAGLAAPAQTPAEPPHRAPAVAAGVPRVTRSRAAWAATAALGALGVLAALWMAASLTWPPGFDHGLYVWTADVVLRGGMVYRDAWDMHGPLAAYLYALPLALTGPTFWGVRLLDLAILAGSAYAAARLAARATPADAAPGAARAVGVWTAVVLVLAYASNESEYTAQPDGWIGLATAPALAAVALAPRPGRRHMVLAGVLAGLFALIKPFYGMFVFVPLAYYVTLVGRDWRRGAAAVAVAAAASLVPIAATVAWFAARGALDALVEVHLRYTTLTYAGGGPMLGERAAALFRFVLGGPIVPVAFAAALAGGVALWRTGRRPLAAALTTWVAVAVFCALLQHKYYRYHWIPVYPAVLLLAAAGIGSALRRGARDAWALAGATAAVIAAHSALRPAAFVKQWASYAAGRTSHDAYYALFADASPSLPIERMRAGRWLRDRTPPTASVVVWGTDPGVLHYARRAAPSRIGAWSWPIFHQVGTPVQRRYEAEYLRDLRTRTPDYFVANTRLRASTFRALHTHPAVYREVTARFALDTTIGPYQIWRRRVPPAGGR
jgi:hypothetical protein